MLFPEGNRKIKTHIKSDVPYREQQLFPIGNNKEKYAKKVFSL